jgi:hypothetical protein
MPNIAAPPEPTEGQAAAAGDVGGHPRPSPPVPVVHCLVTATRAAFLGAVGGATTCAFLSSTGSVAFAVVGVLLEAPVDMDGVQVVRVLGDAVRIIGPPTLILGGTLGGVVGAAAVVANMLANVPWRLFVPFAVTDIDRPPPAGGDTGNNANMNSSNDRRDPEEAPAAQADRAGVPVGGLHNRDVQVTAGTCQWDVLRFGFQVGAVTGARVGALLILLRASPSVALGRDLITNHENGVMQTTPSPTARGQLDATAPSKPRGPGPLRSNPDTLTRPRLLS